MKHVVALLPVLIAFQAGAPPALAWTWPVDGPVLRPFVLGDDPYAARQHRGADIGAPSGAPVRAPVSGEVSFAGTVPGGGRTVTLRTADGYSVTLVHLGSIAVGRAAPVAEGAVVGSVGPSGDAEHAEPYVHLGVRLTADPNGYLDPLSFLPVRQAPPPATPVPPAEEAPEPPAQQPPVPTAPGTPAPEPVAPPPAPAASVPVSPQERGEAGVAASGLLPARSLGSGAETAASTGIRAARNSTGEGRGAPRIARTDQRGFDLPVFTRLGAAADRDIRTSSPDRAPAGISAGVPPGGMVAIALAGLVGLGLALRGLDQFGDARAADVAPAMLGDRPSRAAEDASAARSAQENRLVSNRDLESVTLGEPEALADLDRDDDPAELVQVPNDAGCRLPATGANRRFHRVGSRPPRHGRRPAVLADR